jgi:hypothetical protein
LISEGRSLEEETSDVKELHFFDCRHRLTCASKGAEASIVVAAVKDQL